MPFLGDTSEKGQKRPFLGIPGIFFTSKTPFKIGFYMEMSFQKKIFFLVSPNGKGANFTQTLNVP